MDTGGQRGAGKKLACDLGSQTDRPTDRRIDAQLRHKPSDKISACSFHA